MGLQRGIISGDEFRIILSVTALSLVISPLYMNAIRRLHRTTLYQQASVRYVFRVAFGREADWIRTALQKISAVRFTLPDSVKRFRRRKPPAAPPPQ